MTLDQQAAFMVGGEVERAEHAVTLALAQPALGGVQQRGGGGGIALALEEAEQAPAVVLELVQSVIDVRGDPPDGLSVTPGEEILRLGVLEEWVATAIDVPPAFGQQRRNPVRLPPVEPPRQPDERLALSPAALRVEFRRGAAVACGAPVEGSSSC